MPNDISKFMASEKELYLWIVDTLAHEYGWTIEYIEDLQLPAIFGLIKMIRKRKDLEDQLFQMNTAKGFTGKIGSNYKKDVNMDKEAIAQQELGNLKKLSKMLNIPLKGEK